MRGSCQPGGRNTRPPQRERCHRHPTPDGEKCPCLSTAAAGEGTAEGDRGWDNRLETPSPAHAAAGQHPRRREGAERVVLNAHSWDWGFVFKEEKRCF